MIQIGRRDNHYSYIRCIDDLEEFNRLEKTLKKINDKFFDTKYQTWVCDTKSAERIVEVFSKPNINVDLKLQPYLYQLQCLDACINKNAKLIHLSCGAGKTPCALMLYKYLRDNNMLSGQGVIVVKATLKSQWLSEVSKFTDYNASIIDTYKSVTSSIQSKIKSREKKMKSLIKDSAVENKDKIAKLDNEINELKKDASNGFVKLFNNDYDLLILNFETLDDPVVKDILKKQKIDFWFIDEIDNIKDPDTKRSKNLAEFNNSKFKFGATATPIRKNPVDLYGVFHFLKPDLFPNRNAFELRYTKKYFGRIVGSQNEDELSNIITPFIFSRTFEEISDQLPQQVVIQKYCELSPAQLRMHKKLMTEVQLFKEEQETMAQRFTQSQLRNNAEYERLNGNIVARQTFAQMLADSEDLLKASESSLSKQYLTGTKSSKVELCVELVKSIIDSGEKVCIFSRYIAIQDILEKAFIDAGIVKNKQSIARIDGSVDSETRQEKLNFYNTSLECNILLVSDAAESGVNLKSTKYLIEFDLADSAAKQTQRHGRITRADSIHRTVVVYQLIAKESFDEIAMMIIEKKAKYAEDIL